MSYQSGKEVLELYVQYIRPKKSEEKEKSMNLERKYIYAIYFLQFISSDDYVF